MAVRRKSTQQTPVSASARLMKCRRFIQTPPRVGLETPSVLEFDQELIGIELPPIQQRPHVVVINDE
jgi:hypothetical protein